MDLNTFNIQGPIEVVPKRISDSRGYFSETFRLNEVEPQIGSVTFVQANESCSIAPGTIRGIHFQCAPRAQGKLIRCTAGAVFDVAVDLRSGSPNFGHWEAVTLTSSKGNRLWIPPGFGHGFCTLEPNSVVSYWVTDYYSPSHDKGVKWNDPRLGIEWPDVADGSTLSQKDRELPPLSDLPKYF